MCALTPLKRGGKIQAPDYKNYFTSLGVVNH